MTKKKVKRDPRDEMAEAILRAVDEDIADSLYRPGHIEDEETAAETRSELRTIISSFGFVAQRS